MLNVSNALVERAFTCFDCGTSLFSISASHYAEVCSLPTKDWRASLVMRTSKFLLLESPRHRSLGDEVRMRITYRTLARWNISSTVERTRTCHQDEILGARSYLPYLSRIRSNGLSFAHNSSRSLAALRVRLEGLVAEDSETLNFNRHKIPSPLFVCQAHQRGVSKPGYPFVVENLAC